MLDVVFILLIFFVVTATFVNELGVDLPQTPPPSTADASSEPPVRVLLEAGGAVRVDAARLAGIGNVQLRRASTP